LENCITFDKLDTLLQQSPASMLAQGSEHLQTLAHFVCKYSRCATDRERILSLLKKEQYLCYKADPEKEKRNDFKCISDFLTVSDEAFTFWQARQSIRMWKAKRSNPDDKSLKYSCNTLYTSTRQKRKRGSTAVTNDGMDNYVDVLKFFTDFRKDPLYDVFRRACNAKAKEYGFIDNISPVESDADSNDEAFDDGEVPVFEAPITNVTHI
jgi:hypothetical protein